MRTVALNPPYLRNFSRGQRSPAVTRSGTLYYPIWLAYAVGALEQAGHSVNLIDAPADNLSEDQTVDRIDRINPDLIVIETSTPSIESDVAFADRLASAERFIVLVGTHPSALPLETMAMGCSFNGIIVGEYELPLLELAARLKLGMNLDGVEGLALRTGNGVVISRPTEYLTDLDSLPFVSSVYARHLNITRYNNPNALFPQVMIMGGRGCPHRCSFCVFPQTIQGRKWRRRSVSNIVAEMKWVEENLPRVKAVFFEDDTISVDRKRLRELADGIKDAGVRISWTANMRADVDVETLKACRNAGLRTVCVGFESGSDTILKTMRKGITTETMRKFAAAAREADVLVHGCFLVGIQGETRETMEQTLSFALELDPDTAQFYPLMVYPGTEAFEEARSCGNLTESNWCGWLTSEGLHNCVIRTDELTGTDLVDFCDLARRKFYLRPGYILKKAWRSIIDSDERRRTLKAFGTFRRYLLHRSSKGRGD